MILGFLAVAFGEDPTSTVDVPPVVAAEPVTAAAPIAAPLADAPAPTAPPADRRALRLAGFHDEPNALHLGGAGAQSGKVEHRFSVVGPGGPMTVTELLRSVDDPAVRKLRQREVTVAVILGSIGVATAASMLAVHSIEAINNDPVAEPATAVAGTLGFVLGVVSFGVPLQSDTQPWRYWTSDALQLKVDAYNAALPPVVAVPAQYPPPVNTQAPPASEPPSSL